MIGGRIERLDGRQLPFLVAAEKLCFGANAWSEAMIKESLENRFGYFLGIFLDTPQLAGEVKAADSLSVPVCVGYLAARVLGAEAELLSIAILPDYRGRGFGRQLLEYWCGSEPSVREIFLEVRVSNTAAIGLYQQLGFISLGYRKNYYSHPREDALIMKKELRSASVGPIGAELFS